MANTPSTIRLAQNLLNTLFATGKWTGPKLPTPPIANTINNGIINPGVVIGKVNYIGGTFYSATSGARIEIMPDESDDGLVAHDVADNVIFRIIVDGTDTGDVVIGDYASDKGLMWDYSTSTFYIKGTITTGAGSILDGQYLVADSVANAAMKLGLRGWTFKGIFSSTDYNTVAWSAETFTAADGTAYSIDAGNTGNMAALTYIYLDIAVSTTALQTTTTAATAVGDGKCLIAVAQNNTDTNSDASYQVFGGTGGITLFVDNLAANSASVNEFVSNTAQIANLIVTNAKINDCAVDKLTTGSIASKQITLTVAAGTGDSYIAAGKTDFDNTVAGFILGLDDSVAGDPAKLYIGDANKYFNWDGTTLIVQGTIQTGPDTGERIVLDSSSNHLAGFNSVPAQTIDLDADDVMLKLYSSASRYTKIYDGCMTLVTNADITGSLAAMLIIDNNSASQGTLLDIDTVATGFPTTHYLINAKTATTTQFSLREDGYAYFAGSIGMVALATIDGVDVSAHAAATDAHSAVSTNTASRIVLRDGSGNFAAGTITASLTGNCSGSSGSCTGNASTATTADKVANALTFSTGLSCAGTFDGATARTVTVDLGTGATQAAYGNHNHTGVYDPAGTAASAVSTHAALTTGVHGLAITAGQTLTVTVGGTIGSAAYTASTDYAPAAHVGAGGAAHADATTDAHGFMTDTQFDKLDGIETGADVTDATNVAAAGALMDADFASAGFMKTDGAGAYSVAADGSDTDFNVVTNITLTLDPGIEYILYKYVRALTLDNGLITVVGDDTGSEVGTWPV